MNGIRTFQSFGCRKTFTGQHRRRHLLYVNPNELIRYFSSIAPVRYEEDLLMPQGPSKALDVQYSTPSTSVDFATLKCGVGTIVATGTPMYGTVPSTTKLSTVSHKSPVRLIPTTTSISTIAKQVSIGHYGGGMTEGDTATINIQVKDHARLHVKTQGINRVYGYGNQQPYRIRGHEDRINNEEMKSSNKMSTNTVHAVVHENSILVYTPDPVSLHTGAQYEQSTDYILQDAITSNLVAVDWICSGRRYYSEESEYWNHTSCTTRTTIRFASNQQQQQQQEEEEIIDDQNDIPVLIDAQSISVEAMDAFTVNNQQFHAIVTVLLSGSLIVDDDILHQDGTNDSVIQRFVQFQSALMVPYTSVRTTDDSHSSIVTDVQKLMNEQLSVGGRVVLGITKSLSSSVTSNPTTDEAIPTVPIYTVRIAATSNEDIYRILHYCLQPISLHMNGIECYKDRIITSSQSPPTKIHNSLSQPRQQVSVSFNTDTSSTILPNNNNPLLSKNFWTAYMLADSALPIGSFAHSSGIEVVQQLGFLSATTKDVSNEHDMISTFIRVAVQSTIRLSTPLIWCSSHITNDIIQNMSNVPSETNNNDLLEMKQKEYTILDSYTNAIFATNGPSCRASLDQGRNLLRIAQSIIASSTSTSLTTSNENQQHTSVILSLLDDAIERSNGGHITTIFGVVSRLLQLNEYDAVRLYGYCVARDIVNAAVRLNMVGPMAGQTILLHHAQPAVLDAIYQSERSIQQRQQQMVFQHDYYDRMKFNPTELTTATILGNTKTSASLLQSVILTSVGCVPILDTLHPCHDVLATRLFRS